MAIIKNGVVLAEDGATRSGNVEGDGTGESFVVDDNSTVGTAGNYIFTQAGGDTVRLDSGGRITGAIESTSTATQSDIYEIFNDSGNLDAGLTPQQTIIGFFIRGGSGNDSVTIDGSGYTGTDPYAISIGRTGQDAIYAGAGDDQISITDSVIIKGNILTEGGSDTLDVGTDVRVDGNIIANTGDLGDTITFAQGSTLTNSIQLGSGKDNVTLAGNIGDGSTTDRITSGSGEDTITVTSTAVLNVAQIQMEGGAGESQTITIENGAEVTLRPASYGAGILTGSGDDTIFLGGKFSNFTGTDVDALSGSDYITIGSEFSSADNVGTTDAQKQFLIMGRDDAGDTDTDTLDISKIMGRIDRHTPDENDAENGTIYLNDGSIIRYTDIEEIIMCFAQGTIIATVKGARAIETLRKDDLVLTSDNGLQPIRWIGSRKLSEEELEASPKLRPIRIRAGAIGKNLPTTDLMVSPQHRILVRSKIAQKMFDTDEVLVGAKHLLELEGVEIADDVTEVEYFHMLFDRHEVVFSNGAETESLHTGRQALKALGSAAREEIFTLFPELRNNQTDEVSRPSARPLITGRQGRQLAMRHGKNGRELVF